MGLGEIHTVDEAPIVREMQGLIGPLTGDEAALVRALTPAWYMSRISAPGR